MYDASAFAISPDAALHHRTVQLATGRLHLQWREHGARLDELCCFAARYNNRRGFLIVSRVLGRHVPARPRAIRAASDALSAIIPADLPGPVLFVGLAEIAITLGQSVHAAWQRRSRRRDALFLHSTRQMLGREPLIRFSEPHSHAASHLLYEPDSNVWPQGLEQVQSLVLVDDEVTTGNTFVNLAAQLAPLLPRLRQVDTAVLTDWTSGGAYLAAMPRRASGHALLSGTLVWDAEADEGGVAPNACGALGQLVQRRNFGRLGSTGAPLALAALTAQFDPADTAPLHIIGTGELHHPAFLLAEQLEQAGHDVLLQAVTRSPARLGEAITASRTLCDNYGAQAANYLYNLDQTAARRRVICHETPPESIDPALLRPHDWGAIDFGALT